MFIISIFANNLLISQYVFMLFKYNLQTVFIPFTLPKQQAPGVYVDEYQGEAIVTGWIVILLNILEKNLNFT